MGLRASAVLAWGIDLADPEEEELHHSLGDDFDLDDDLLYAAFGFTDPWPHRQHDFNELSPAERERRETAFFAARRAAKPPVEYDTWGSSTVDDGATGALILSRSRVRSTWAEAIGPATLTPPTDEEIAALNTACDHIGFTGDRTPRLLLLASYG